MKRPVFSFSVVAFRLIAYLFAFLCLSSIGHASSPPANDVHFCLPLNLKDMQTRDSIYAATKHTLNLNVGALRTVRMIYFLPNDRPFRQEVVDSMKVTIRQIQTFYAQQMQAFMDTETKPSALKPMPKVNRWFIAWMVNIPTVTIFTSDTYASVYIWRD